MRLYDGCNTVVEHLTGNLKIEGSNLASGTGEIAAERFKTVNTLAKSKRENYKSKKACSVRSRNGSAPKKQSLFASK